MKILFLSAANSIHTVRWVNGLTQRGHEVHLVYNAGHEPRDNKINENVKLYCLKHSGGKAYYLNGKELSELTKKIDPEVINVHYASGYGTLARKAGLQNELLSVWGSDVYEFPQKSIIHKMILKRNVKHAKRIASTSECMAQQLKKVLDMPELDIAITPFGVDLERFVLEKGKKDEKERIIGTVKGLEPVYKIDDFIKSVALMKSKVKVHIYGDGSQKATLENLIQQLGLQDSVFLKGRVPNTEVPAILEGFDVFGAMSEKESFGVAVVEAMAMGVPVVVSDAEGFQEVVSDGETGFIVPRGNVEMMAQKLDLLVENEELRNRFGKAGRDRVEALYDWQKNLDTMETLYKEMTQRRCIVHIPNSLNPKGTSGSQVRPKKMIQAFKDSGFLVDVVIGESDERKKQINRIKQNIKNGVIYDFLYSESSTMPTLLTDRSHIPKHPFLDFGFFKFCKRHGIRIGLFYRDIQWKFPMYREHVSIAKRMISIPMYRYDLKKYEKLLNVLYLPTERMKRYLNEYPALLVKSDILMPGCEENKGDTQETVEPFENEGIHIFYVGGIVGIYDIKAFLETVANLEGVNTIICCREHEWQSVAEMYREYLTANVRIVHASGAELEKYYAWADVCSVLAGTGEYFSMAMPVKVFEYLSKYKPMLGIKGTVSGEFIEREDIGWSTEYDVKSLKNCISHIVEYPEEIRMKKNNEYSIFEKHTWRMRAHKVAQDLEGK